MNSNTVQIILLAFTVISFFLGIFDVFITHEKRRAAVFLVIFIGLAATALLNHFQTFDNRNNQQNSESGNIDTGTHSNENNRLPKQEDKVEVKTTPNSWVQKLPFPAKGMREAVCFSIGEFGFVGITQTREFWAYNSITNQWNRKANLPNGIGFQPTSFVIGDKGYVGFGSNNVTGSNVLWQYDIISDSWTQMASIPSNGKRAAFGFAIGHKAYVGGGFYDGDELWEYDSEQNNWLRKNDIPHLKRFPNNSGDYFAIGAFSFVLNNRGYVTGTNCEFFMYDPSLDKWEKKASVNPVYGNSFVIGPSAYVYNTMGELYQYNAYLDAWSVKANCPKAIAFPITFSIRGKGYVGIGGEFVENEATLNVVNDLWEYTPDNTGNLSSKIFETGPAVKDIDGNNYETIKIGDQTWFKQNLAVTRFRDGSKITEIEDSIIWGSNLRNYTDNSAWCYYNGNSLFNSTYGKLYNWYAINNRKGICPYGWHIPDTLEWRILIDYLGGELIAGGALKCDTFLWTSTNSNTTNISNFSCLPAGWCFFNGGSLGIGMSAYYWTSTSSLLPRTRKDFSSYAWDIALSSNSSKIKILNTPKNSGFSCRCIKDDYKL